VVLCACAAGEADTPPDARPSADATGALSADARPGPGPDAAGPDAAAAPDAGPLAGFGTLSGACGVLEPPELTGDAPTLHRDAIDFAVAYDETHLAELSAGGQEIIHDGNAGGSSLLSEVFAYEVLHRCERAALLKTENEVLYDDPLSKKTDLLVEIDGLKIGVSVTRAYVFPPTQPYTVAAARDLLEGKLADILSSSASVAAQDRWEKQILLVVAYAPGHADSIETAYATVDGALQADTILWVTVTDGMDAFIY
jgi:hypothetical protein